MRCFCFDFPYFLQYYQTCSYVRLEPNGEHPVASWPNSIPKHGAKIDSDPHTCERIFSLASHLHAVSVKTFVLSLCWLVLNYQDREFRELKPRQCEDSAHCPKNFNKKGLSSIPNRSAKHIFSCKAPKFKDWFCRQRAVLARMANITANCLLAFVPFIFSLNQGAPGRIKNFLSILKCSVSKQKKTELPF